MQDKELRDLGLKATMPRIKILKILEEADPRHISAEIVYQKLTEQGEVASLATVYRVLTQFETAGLVKRLHFEGDHSVFEMDDGKHHDHLVCVKCGAVAEFMDELIEQQQIKIAEQKAFKMTDHSLTIYGICSNCER